MASFKVPAHLNVFPSWGGHTFIRFVALCFLLCLHAAFATENTFSHEPLPAHSLATIGLPPPNTVWDAGSILDIMVVVPTTSIFSEGLMSALTLGVDSRSEDSIYRTAINAESGLIFVRREPRDNITEMWYRWPIPCNLPVRDNALKLYNNLDQEVLDWVAFVVRNHDENSPCLLDHPTTEAVLRHTFNVQSQAKRNSIGSEFNSSILPSGLSLSGTETGIITVTAGTTGLTLTPSGLPATIVIEPNVTASTSTASVLSSPSSSYSGFSTVRGSYTGTATVNGSDATVTVTDTKATATSVTVVLTSLETIVSTTTAPGTTIEFTSTQTSVSTTMVVMTQGVSGGFLPVTAAAARVHLSSSSVLFTLSLPIMLFIAHLARVLI